MPDFASPCPCPKNERGSALLLVLGILSIGLALAASFAVIIVNEDTAAQNHLDEVKARLLADSGLRQAMVAMKIAYDPSDGANDAEDKFPSTRTTNGFYAPVTGPFAGRRYSCSKSLDSDEIDNAMKVIMDDFEYMPKATLDTTTPATPTIEDRGFFPVVGKNIYGADRVIGRFAYMIIDESGKIDPNAAVIGSVSEATGSEPRSGAGDFEICLEDANLAGYESYILPAGLRWFSMRQIARNIVPADFETQVIQVLHPFSVEQELYWSDDNDDDLYDTGEDYPRLDLSSDQDTSLAQLYKAFIAPDDTDTALPNIGDLDDANDCEWIKKLAMDGVATDGATRRRIAAQTALNIRDSVDTDSDATVAWVNTDGELTTSFPGPPNVEVQLVGRENQYGLSELSVKIECIVPLGGGPRDLTMNVYFKGEIFYPGAISEPLGSNTLTVRFSVTGWSESVGTRTFFTNTTSAVPLGSSANEEGGTLRYSSGWQLAGTSTRNNFLENLGKRYGVTNFQIESVVLNDGTTNIDDFPSQPNNSYWWNWDSSTNLLLSNNLFATLEALDPLNNEDDEGGPTPGYGSLWTASPTGTDEMYENIPIYVDIGQLTRISGPLSESTLSEYSDITVKDAAFTRVGEIGRVGSYWPGRSLRLWADAGDEAGMDTYLLDMFTIGPASGKRGRVNINSLNDDVLTALLNDTTTVAIADAVAAIQTARLASTFTNISDFFNVAGITGTDKTLDDTEEAMVEKIAELITVRQTYFTVIVTAQSIKDLGGQVVYKDLNNDGDTYDTGEAITTVYGTYEHYGDEILATSKLLAVISRDAFSNAISIEHLEYLR